MPYKENTPTFNTGRKVVNFKDFLSDPKAEEEKLKKAKRSYMPNSDMQQFVRNSRTEYNPVTHKLTDYTEDEIEDKISAIEEETNENTNNDHFFSEISSEEKEICLRVYRQYQEECLDSDGDYLLRFDEWLKL